ncbi:divergent PAP2 family protein [Candidatus Saccharibacteria bacterium]|nr:divergent PAP2 family protein [Candidatus Saccharibacteria bacterium]
MISEYLYIPLITWGIAQMIKFSIAVFKGEYRPSLLFSSGGMPSVHSATVSALATTALLLGGAASPLFGITGIFAAIVMYDSLGVRRSAGEQAKTLNRLINDLVSAGAVKTPSRYTHLKEILGHRPLEVLIGSLLGIVLSAVFLYRRLFEYAPWLTTVPSRTSQYIQLGLAGIVLVTSIMAFIQSGRLKSRLYRYKPFFKQIFIANLSFSIVLAVLVLSQREAIIQYGWWLGACIAFMAFLFWQGALWYRLLVDGALQRSRPSATEMRQEKWLKTSKKTKRKK